MGGVGEGIAKRSSGGLCVSGVLVEFGRFICSPSGAKQNYSVRT